MTSAAVPPGSQASAGLLGLPLTGAVPVSAPGTLVTALGAAAISLVLTGAVLVSRPLAMAAVLVLQIVVTLGWLSLVGSSVGLIDVGLVMAAAVAADVVLLHSRQAGPGSLSPVIGVTFVAAMLRQLGRRQRTDLTVSLMATASAVALCCAPTVLIPLGLGDTGRAVAASGLLAAAAALAVGALVHAGLNSASGSGQRGQLVSAAAGIIAGAAAGVGLSLVAASAVAGGRALGNGDACVVGLVTALAAGSGYLAAVRGLPTNRVWGLPALAACLPVLLAVPTAYTVGRLLL